ncbi:MAG: hypothetical protein K9W43_03580 [Candidatus Thorarchaeota archaeon]|nr:hypothetical protein [Candidatus Thorarchaeota archaeon]
MPAAVFVIRFDDKQGFLVAKRYPSTFSLNEKLLNLVYYNHVQGGSVELQLHEIEEKRMVTFGTKQHPGWLVCFVLAMEEDFGPNQEEFSAMGRLMLELAVEDPNLLDIGDIIRNRSGITEPAPEQMCASIFLTPSSLLLLERLQEKGIDRSAALSVWLRNQVQTEDIDILRAIRPLMASDIVRVEAVEKKEVVFLLRDVFAFRSPPVEALRYTQENLPELYESYKHSVKEFFSPDPPAKGYNPTLPADDPNAPIIEDREKLAALLSKNLTYAVLNQLRTRPMQLKEICTQTALPESVVNKILWTLEAERVAISTKSGYWLLVSDPIIETFMPEYALPIIKQRFAEKEIGQDIVGRYLELLIETWSET